MPRTILRPALGLNDFSLVLLMQLSLCTQSAASPFAQNKVRVFFLIREENP